MVPLWLLGDVIDVAMVTCMDAPLQFDIIYLFVKEHSCHVLHVSPSLVFPETGSPVNPSIHINPIIIQSSSITHMIHIELIAFRYAHITLINIPAYNWLLRLFTATYNILIV